HAKLLSRASAQQRAGGLAQQRAATTQTPRRPIGAGGVRGASRSGSASVITTHALFARKVQRKRSNGVAGFAAGGSSSERKRSRPIRAFSATPHDGQRPCNGMPSFFITVFPYALQRVGHAYPALSPARALLARIPLGVRPWLRRLRCGRAHFVRRLPSYYGGV